MGKPKLELTGKKFGRLLVINPVGTSGGRTFWLCKCECGKKKRIVGIDLKGGHTKSCGCSWAEKCRENAALYNTRHGDFDSPTYRSWAAMLYRCRNTRSKDYKRYGGRGISVCSRWLKYEAFRMDMGLRPAGTSIDRINVDGNYEPANCRWATPKQQANNRRKRK